MFNIWQTGRPFFDEKLLEGEVEMESNQPNVQNEYKTLTEAYYNNPLVYAKVRNGASLSEIIVALVNHISCQNKRISDLTAICPRKMRKMNDKDEIEIINLSPTSITCCICGEVDMSRWSVPINSVTGLICSNDFKGEWGAKPVCHKCWVEHNAGQFIGCEPRF